MSYELPFAAPAPSSLVDEWVADAFMIRACGLVIDQMTVPQPRSALALDGAGFEWDRPWEWARTYLAAAAEHLALWADYHVPYTYHEGSKVTVRYRPGLLLARAGLEASSHVAWLLSSTEREERIACHLGLARRDLGFHKKALEVDGRDASAVERRIQTLLETGGRVLPGVSPQSPRGFAELVGHGARVTGLDANRTVYLWNAASGAGHGQNWFASDGYDRSLRDEPEPDYRRVWLIPNLSAFSETMRCATTVLSWGARQWLEMAGEEADTLFQAALLEVYERMPKVDRE